MDHDSKSSFVPRKSEGRSLNKRSKSGFNVGNIKSSSGASGSKNLGESGIKTAKSDSEVFEFVELKKVVITSGIVVDKSGNKRFSVLSGSNTNKSKKPTHTNSKNPSNTNSKNSITTNSKNPTNMNSKNPTNMNSRNPTNMNFKKPPNINSKNPTKGSKLPKNLNKRDNPGLQASKSETTLKQKPYTKMDDTPNRPKTEYKPKNKQVPSQRPKQSETNQSTNSIPVVCSNRDEKRRNHRAASYQQLVNGAVNIAASTQSVWTIQQQYGLNRPFEYQPGYNLTHGSSSGYNSHNSYSLGPFASLNSPTRPVPNNLVINPFCFRRPEIDTTTTCRAKCNSAQEKFARSWENTYLGNALLKNNGGKNPGLIFTLMSYNVLAQDLVIEHPHLYLNHEKAALSWDVRWKNLLREIKEHDCDIMCLQEVQQSHLDDYFTKLQTLGYRFLFKKRTGAYPDGCAIFYKTDKFELVEYTTIEYYQDNDSVLNRDNVAIIAKFAPKSNLSSEFIVATTHLLYNPRRDDVRIAQTQLLLTEIDRMAFSKSEKYLPIIVTGDFNTQPMSLVYHLITKGRLDYFHGITGGLIPPYLRISDACQHINILNHRETGNMTREIELELIELRHSERTSPTKQGVSKPEDEQLGTFGSGTITHDLCLKSVYTHGRDCFSEVTTNQDGWITVDYIFYRASVEDNKFKDTRLKLLSRYKLPVRNQLGNELIPNMVLGSDHLCLIARFKLEY